MTALLERTASPKKRTQGARVVRFMEEYCVIPEGDLIGQPFTVPKFWRDRLNEMFELRPQTCELCGEVTTFTERGPDDGYRCAVCTQVIESLPPEERRYSEIIIGIAKKNIKSSIMCGLGFYFLLGDGDPSALVVSAASTEKQGANLLFGSARAMCELSPKLREVCTAYKDEILVPSTPRARMQNVASKSGAQDGPNIKALLADELHEWLGQRGRDLWTVLTGGTGARINAIKVAITTAGFDQNSLCFEKYEYGKKVNAGEIDDDGFYFYWLEAPDDADHRDRKVWAMVNPLLGTAFTDRYLEERLKRDPESVFRRYHTNQWVAGESIWIPYGAWDKGYAPELVIDATLPLYAAIDIAKTIDSSALATCQPKDMRPLTCPVCGEVGAEFEGLGAQAADGYLCSICRDVIEEAPPEIRCILGGVVWENPYPEKDSRHQTWRMNNHLVMDVCRDLYSRYRAPSCEIDGEIKGGPCFGFDPWRFRAEAETLTGEGLAMVEFPQNDQRMIPVSQGFFECIMRGQHAHDGTAVFKRHVQNVTADAKDRGWRMSKPKGSKLKIDWAIAAGIARYLAETMKPAARSRSAYEDHDLIVIG